MSNQITLAATKIGGQEVTVELIESPGDSASVTITWPSKALSVSPRRFPEVMATLTRLFANASLELARMEAGDRPPMS